MLNSKYVLKVSYKFYLFSMIILFSTFTLSACSNKKNSNLTEDNSDTKEVNTSISNSDKEISNNSDISNLNLDLINWIKETTNLEIYLPIIWKPIKQNEKDINYYLETTGNKSSYNINVYETKVPVKFNDPKDLLDKNGPISDTDYVGTISGGLDNNTDFSFDIPKESKSFDLIKGVTAYQLDDAISVWWNQQNWKFGYNGPTNLIILEKLATAWSTSEIKVANSGNVIIIGGNKLTFYYNWEKEGQKYTFITQNTDFENTIKILNSFIKIK